MTDKLQNIVSETLDSWSNENIDVSKSYFLKRFREIVGDIPIREKIPDPWEDNTPFNKCKWFVYYDNGDEEFLNAFGSKKKALLYMDEVKKYDPALIKGSVIRSVK